MTLRDVITQPSHLPSPPRSISEDFVSSICINIAKRDSFITLKFLNVDGVLLPLFNYALLCRAPPLFHFSPGPPAQPSTTLVSSFDIIFLFQKNKINKEKYDAEREKMGNGRLRDTMVEPSSWAVVDLCGRRWRGSTASTLSTRLPTEVEACNLRIIKIYYENKFRELAADIKIVFCWDDVWWFFKSPFLIFTNGRDGDIRPLCRFKLKTFEMR